MGRPWLTAGGEGQQGDQQSWTGIFPGVQAEQDFRLQSHD